MKSLLKISRICISCDKEIKYVEDIGIEIDGVCNCSECNLRSKKAFNEMYKKYKQLNKD